MAHFALINDMNTVKEIIVVNNDVLLDDEGVEQESLGQAFIASIGIEGTWLQCSYNGNFRGVYPRLGFLYDPELDEFVPAIPEAIEG